MYGNGTVVCNPNRYISEVEISPRGVCITDSAIYAIVNQQATFFVLVAV